MPWGFRSFHHAAFRAPPPLKLEDLQPDATVRGILPDALATVVSVEWHGSDAVTLVYRGPDGHVGDEILYRNDEPRLEIAHLTGQLGAEVMVTLEIDAKLPDGATDHVVRTVTENSRTLKFTGHGFESE